MHAEIYPPVAQTHQRASTSAHNSGGYVHRLCRRFLQRADAEARVRRSVNSAFTLQSENLLTWRAAWLFLIQPSVIMLANKMEKKGKKSRGGEGWGESQGPISLGSPESDKNKWRWVQDKHAPEMRSKLSRRLIESTLIKMLTETLWIYERGLTRREKKQHSAPAKVTICQVFSRCTESRRHICTGPPTHEPSLIRAFFFPCIYFQGFGFFLLRNMLFCFVLFCFLQKI